MIIYALFAIVAVFALATLCWSFIGLLERIQIKRGYQHDFKAFKATPASELRKQIDKTRP